MKSNLPHGVDYNIFLMSRMREESALRPVGEAIVDALEQTGPLVPAIASILGERNWWPSSSKSHGLMREWRRRADADILR